MKQLLSKLTARLRRKPASGEKSTVPRITNDTLAEHREEIIAKGKRYKYPMQQTKNRTVIISTLIVLFLLLAVMFFTWWQLYKAQNTSQFMYRITQILPLGVAKVDGETVLYRDYLQELRSTLHYLTSIESVNLASDDGQRQLSYQKRQAMNKVLEQAYVRKLARENNISVSPQEVDSYIDGQISMNEIGATAEDFRSVIREYYDWTFEEYRQSIQNQLLRRKVVAVVDDSAREKAESILARAQKGTKFADLARKESDDEATKQAGGDVGFVRVTSPDPDGLVAVAAGLAKNKVSDIIVGTSGLYIVQTLEKRGDSEVRFARILVRFSEFENRFSALREEGKIQEYIDVPTTSTAVPER